MSSSHPALPASHPEARTDELDTADVAMLEKWSRGHLARAAAPSMKAEAGLRVCPRCGRPVHLGAVSCRECGTHVPRR
jgi:ribosomal protein L40E